MDEQDKKIRILFQRSREGAIVRCAEVMVDSNRKDLAKQILDTAHIDRARLSEIKSQQDSQGITS